jgi:tRNA (guanine37-N1)-methyltransferase
MEIHVLTIFPEMLASFLQTSLLGKAVSRGLVRVRVWNIRDSAADRHRSTDDEPYGGGPGMVMKAEPIVTGLEAVARDAGPGHRVLLGPCGGVLSQRRAATLAAVPRLILVCGRYEGVDERVRAHVDEELSIGD